MSVERGETMKEKLRRILPVIVILVLAGAALGWYLLTQAAPNANGAITASGTVEAVEVVISPELSGRVAEVLVAQGETVAQGQPLFRLDGALLQAQRKSAEAGLAAAQSGLETARAALDTARTQFEQVLETARLAESPARSAALGSSQPADFDQPIWYFTKEEQIAAMEAEVEAARKALDDALEELDALRKDPAYAGILSAETRLALARASYLTSQDALNRAKASGDADVIDAAQETFDAVQTELEDAQQAYDELLATDQGRELLKARARVRAAEDRYHAALDRLARLHTGEDSYPVKLAAAAVRQAEASAAQAEKAVNQAQAQLDALDAQIEKLTVFAPSAGTVIERNIQPGEVAVAGSAALILGQLDRLTITVYIPEDRYGDIRLEQTVGITVDSFPGLVFSGSVTRIADRAQFTPRNVQTEEGRRTTVFAVEITVDDSESGMKPGMPADVVFE
ncbi:MAG: efflux RND transporter periplasmic adaptor subunit [Anaerolineales bacterium]|nr:efflux RND transporter periplasmic adaptor subunit [Anaerolineales bacterium]